MIKLRNDLYFSDCIKDMDTSLIYRNIKSSYWESIRSPKDQNKSINNTFNFGLFKNNTQIGFGRVLSDQVFFAYLLDIFIVEIERGNGYSKLLIEKILNYPGLKNINKWMLTTRDTHGLYKKYGFEVIQNPNHLMERKSNN